MTADEQPSRGIATLLADVTQDGTRGVAESVLLRVMLREVLGDWPKVGQPNNTRCPDWPELVLRTLEALDEVRVPGFGPDADPAASPGASSGSSGADVEQEPRPPQPLDTRRGRR